MAMPRLDYQQPDFVGQVGQGIGTAVGAYQQHEAKQEANAPAPEIMQKWLRKALAGEMSPQEAAVRAKAEHHLSSQPQMPQMPEMPQAPQQPPQDYGNSWRAMGTGGSPLVGGARMTTPPGAKRPEYTETETVTAPRQPAQQPQMSSALPQMPDEEMPIRNRDVPQLVQMAGMGNRGISNDLRLLELGLKERGLNEKQRQFDAQEDLRRARVELMDAQRAGIPERIRQAQQRIGIAQETLGLGWANYEQRDVKNYMAETRETSLGIPSFQGLLNTIQTSPAVAPGEWDYATRRVGDIMGGLPFIGESIHVGLEKVADTALTDEQRQLRSQLALAMQPYRKMAVGSQITAGEMYLIDQIFGQQLSIRDTAAAVLAVKMSMQARQDRAKSAYSRGAAKVPDIQPGQVLPPIRSPYSTGFESNQNTLPPLPEGLSLEEELNNSLTNTGGR